MATKKLKAPILSKKQIQHLRGLAHHVSPLVMIGQHGLTKTIISAITESFNGHELLKIKIQQTAEINKIETTEEITKATRSALVQIIGKMIIIYRPFPPKSKKEKITLP